MPGPNTLGIILELNAAGAIVNARSLGGALVDVQGAAVSAGGSLGAASVNTQDLSQQAMNASQALSTVATVAGRVSEAVLGMFRETTQAANNFEVSMARVAIAMGKTGDRTDLPELVKDYGRLNDKIEQLGRDTEFSMTQSAEAVTVLKQAGLTASEVIAQIDQDMAFSSASAGTVTLAGSAKTALLAVSNLGATAESVGKKGGPMDMMVRTMNSSLLELREMPIVMKSMRAASSILSQSTPQDFLAVAGAMKSTGLSAAQSGQAMSGYARTLGMVLQTLDRKKGKRYKAMQLLGFDRDSFVDAEGKYKNIVTVIDESAGLIQKSLAEIGEAQTFSQLRLALGNEQAANMFIKAQKFLEMKGLSSLREYSDSIAQAYGDAQDAAETYLKTTEGAEKVLSGSWERLEIKFGSLFSGIRKSVVEWLTQVVNAIAEWVQANPVLAKTLGVVAAAVGALAAALGVAATIAATLSLTQGVLGKATALTSGAFNVQAIATKLLTISFSALKAVMLPALLVLAKFAVIAAVVKAAWDEDLGGIRTFMKDWGKDIADVFSIIGPLLSGEAFSSEKWNDMSDRAKRLAMLIVNIKETVEDFVKGFVSGLQPAIAVLKAFASVVLKAFTLLANILAEVGIGLGSFTGEASTASGAANGLGKVVGFLVGGYIALRTWTVASTAARSIAKTVMIAYNWVLNAHAERMTLLAVAQKVWYEAQFLGLLMMDRLKVAWAAFNAVLLTNPILLIVAAIAALTYVIIEFGDAISEALDSVGDFFSGLWDSLTRGLDYVGEQFSKAWDDFWSPVTDLPKTLEEAGSKAIDGFLDGLSNAWDSVVDWWDKALDDFLDFLPFSPAKQGPLHDRPPGHAGVSIMDQLRGGLESQLPHLRATIEGVAGAVQGVTPNAGDPAPTVSQSGSELTSYWLKSIAFSAEQLVEQGAFAPTASSVPQQFANADMAVAVVKEALFGPAQSTEPPSFESSTQQEGKKGGYSFNITANMRVGDLNLSPARLDGAAAEEFKQWMAEGLGELIETEMRKRFAF